MVDDRHITLVDRVTRAFALEIDRHDAAAAVAWPSWPDVATLVGHLGIVHAWVAEIVRTGEPAPRDRDRPAPAGREREWYLDRRADLLDALRSTPAASPCWVIAGDESTSGFWRRRMVFETTKHLVDLRAAGGGARRAPTELAAPDYADGIDELFSVFLRRSRHELTPLPAPVRLEATDAGRTWSITPDWRVTDDDVHGAACLRAAAGDLALVVWERADPLGDAPDRFEVSGATTAVAALRDAPIHR